MKYELWAEDDGYVLFPEDNESARGLLSEAARLAHVIEADSWDEARKRQHELLGWEPYGPPQGLEIQHAIGAALGELIAAGYSVDDYKLVEAANLYRNDPRAWRVTFKPRRLIPADPSQVCVGAGGEVFVDVQQDTRRATIRYGE